MSLPKWLGAGQLSLTVKWSFATFASFSRWRRTSLYCGSNGPGPTEPTSPQPSSISISSLQPHQHQRRHATCKARVSRFEISGTSHSKLSALCPCGRFRRGPVPDHWASMVATTMSACPGYGKEGSQHRTQRGRKSREYNRTWLGPSMGGCNAGYKIRQDICCFEDWLFGYLTSLPPFKCR